MLLYLRYNTKKGALMKQPLSQALELIASKITPLCSKESVPLMKAFGRISAKPVIASISIPPHAISLRDGRTISYDDLKNFDKIDLFNLPTISTGQRVPKNTASIIEEEMLEHIDPKEICASQNFIKAKGEDIQAGDVLLESGSKVGPFDITNLASQGIHTLTVLKEARIAYIGIGDELIDVSSPPKEGYIYNSNAYTMAARGEMMGARTAIITHTKDTPQSILQTFESLEYVDAIITSGGMSPNDAMNALLEDKVLKPLFKGVAMAPAGLTALSFYNATPILHLPGLPMSALLGFEVIGAALIARLYGLDPNTGHITTRTTEPIKAHPYSQSIVPGYFDGECFSPKVIATGMINVLNYCNGFIIVNRGEPLAKDDEVVFTPFLSWH
jgi:molybdopterin molybdotransferase